MAADFASRPPGSQNPAGAGAELAGGHEGRMREALDEARLGAAGGEIPVGAIVCYEGRVVGRGQNRVLRSLDPTAHAEIVAMREAAQALGNYRLTGCSLYATLEPCAMCAGAMIHARLGRLIFGALDPKAGAAGSVLEVLNHPQLNHRMKVEGEVLAEECGDLLRSFFRERRQAAHEPATGGSPDGEIS